MPDNETVTISLEELILSDLLESGAIDEEIYRLAKTNLKIQSDITLPNQ